MRIIAGRFKGQKLSAFSANFIRPMTDRVKTSLFDTLVSSEYLTENTRVLDLFSGTGNLAFEALSRGAKEVCLVEKHKKAIYIIRKNKALIDSTYLNQTGFEKGATLEVFSSYNKDLKPEISNKTSIKSTVKIYHQDVFRFLSSYKGQPFDLVFADPPFKKQYGHKILSACAHSLAIAKDTKLFMELSKQESLPEDSDHYKLISQKKFGDKSLLFYHFF